MMTSRKWECWEDDILMCNYSLASREDIMSKLNRTWASIQCRARKLKVQRETGANYANIRYFDEWSNTMAYMLGLIAADGCVSEQAAGNKVFRIALGEEDKQHVEKIRDELAPSKRVYEEYKEMGGKRFKLYRLQIGSKYFCKRLMELGIEHRKSMTLQFYDVPDKYVSHYIRGYFDGDGSFGIYGKYLEERVCIVSGSKIFLDAMNKKISKHCSLSEKNIHFGKASNTFSLNYHCLEALRVCEWMYNDSTLHLDRKYNKYTSALDYRNITI